MRTFKSVLAAAALAMAASLATPAFAGECPADKVGVNVTPPGPMAPEGVTDTAIGSVDLAGYGQPGRQLRLRRLEIKPGGVVPWHGHAERPANILVMKGRINEYRSTCAVPIEHRQGEVAVEQGDLFHWWKNESGRTVVLISADILPPQAAPEENM